jgi:hypothetical protein
VRCRIQDNPVGVSKCRGDEGGKHYRACKCLSIGHVFGLRPCNNLVSCRLHYAALSRAAFCRAGTGPRLPGPHWTSGANEMHNHTSFIWTSRDLVLRPRSPPGRRGSFCPWRRSFNRRRRVRREVADIEHRSQRTERECALSEIAYRNVSRMASVCSP